MLYVLFLWDIKSSKGKRQKDYGHMDHFRRVRKESNILSKDHIKPISAPKRALGQRQPPSLVKKKKTTQEVLKLSKDVLTRDHVLHYSKDSNNIQSRLQLPFNYAFLTQLKKQITHCDLYQPYMFWESIEVLEKSLAYLPLSWKSLKRSWR